MKQDSLRPVEIDGKPGSDSRSHQGRWRIDQSRDHRENQCLNVERVRIYEIISSNTNLVKEEHHQTKLAAAATRKALKMSEKPNTITEKPTKYQRSLDGTPSRDKPDKRGSYVVAVVDLKCGNPDRTWAP